MQESKEGKEITYRITATSVCEHNSEHTREWTGTATTDITGIDCKKGYTLTYTLNLEYTTEDGNKVKATGDDIEGGLEQEKKYAPKASHEDLVRVPGQSGSCNQAGWKAYYHCPVCEKNFGSYTGEHEVDIETIAPLGHLYGDPTFEWVQEGVSARAIYTCMRPGCTTTTTGHTKTVEAKVNNNENSIFKESESECVGTGKQGVYYYMVSVGEGDALVEGDLSVTQPFVDHKFSGTDGACEYCGQKGLIKVTFIYKNGSEDVTIATEWFGKESDIKVPSTPNRPGYTFKGWSLDGKTIVSNIETEISDMVQAENAIPFTVTAIYEAIQTTGTVTVKYKNGSDLLNYEKPDNGDVYTGVIGKNVAVSAEETLEIGDTKQKYTFSHWEKDGVKLSTSTNYDVYIASDAPITIYAVYQQGTVEKPDAVPVVAMTDIYKLTAEDGTNKLVFTTAMSVPTGYTMKESGILYSASTTFAGKPVDELNELIVLNGANVYKNALNGTKTNLMSVKIASGKENVVIYARGYMICENKEGVDEVYYSDSAFKSYATASELATAQTAQ